MEYYEGKTLPDEEWSAFNRAFEAYWNDLWDNEGYFSFWDMVHAIHANLARQESSYFHERGRVSGICNDMMDYLMSIPHLIPPANSAYEEDPLPEQNNAHDLPF